MCLSCRLIGENDKIKQNNNSEEYSGNLVVSHLKQSVSNRVTSKSNQVPENFGQLI